MIIKVNGLVIKYENFIDANSMDKGIMNILDVDIHDYIKYLSPDSNSFKSYMHEEVPCIYKDDLYILINFSCLGLNTREEKGTASFFHCRKIDNDKILNYFNKKDLIYYESLKRTKKFNL